MTLAELFAASVNGFPEVEYCGELPYAESKIGLVVALNVSRGDGYKGCSVSFPGLNFATWFHAEDGDDKRKKYMRDLRIINPVVKEDMVCPITQKHCDDECCNQQ